MANSTRAALDDDADLSLTALLEKLPLRDLRDIARQRGWKIAGKSRSDMLRALVPLLEDPTEVARAVTSLSENLREGLRAALVAEDGGGITSSSLAQTVTALRGSVGPALKPVEAAGVLQDLAGWGLLIPWRDSPGKASHYLFCWDVQRNLPPLPGWCRPRDDQRHPTSVLSMPKSRFIDLLYAVWQRISDQPWPLRPVPGLALEQRSLNFSRGWGYEPQEVQKRQGVNTTLRTLSVPTPGYLLGDSGIEALLPLTQGNVEQLEYACRLLVELDLVSVEQGHLLARSEVMTRFLRCSASEQYAVVAQACMSLLDWNELDVLLRTDRRLVLRRLVRYALNYDEFRSQLARIHHMLLRFLSTAGESGWCSLEDADASLRVLWPDLAHPLDSDSRPWLGAGWSLAWREDQRELCRDHEGDWQAAQGGILRTMLLCPLYWMGLVDLAMQDGAVRAFRLRGLSDWVWDRPGYAPQTTPQGPAVAVDDAALTIAVQPALVPPQAHTLLGRIARLEGTAPGRFVYHLDQRLTHATFEHGETLADLLAGWQHVMPLRMPAAIEQALGAWWSSYAQVRFYEGLALLELGDEVTLRELEASTALGTRIVARLSARLVLVRDEDVDALLQEFCAHGLTPKEVK